MDKSELRLYYKNQEDLSYALREYIDYYFEGNIEDEKLETNIVKVIEGNRDKFYKNDEVAKKTKQILGKSRLDLIEKILNKKK
ncbi:TIGR04540 family protein [Caproiciproducens sp. MSJ-32]|uniref:TIGR04540 family protein n=1 Tax=Caproiciproducens sp. MSJ-32 TaxID=2841527 RepID=UPI001C0FE8E4|nr:TIGR04540 family protein [Caproiciproducens sp. MSJ-32]MBU5454167.1 TIGR04540 family protein [Caproiciproducens sp. MSJ-32]